jgi:lipoprotein-releasing system permease protein
VPKMRKFKVAGFLRTGYYEYDSSVAYAGLPEAASFLGLKGLASGIEVRLQDIGQVDSVSRRLQRELSPEYTVRTFKQMNRTLFAALKLEKYVMFLILTLIILVAVFNITSNLILMGSEKMRGIGLLKAMGATPAQIRRIFFWEGLFIGGFGVCLGTILGLALSYVIGRYPLVELPADIYYLSRVPVYVDWRDLVTVIGCGFLLTVSATLYPAFRAAAVHPVDAIRYG